jgi:hypothetical protein
MGNIESIINPEIKSINIENNTLIESTDNKKEEKNEQKQEQEQIIHKESRTESMERPPTPTSTPVLTANSKPQNNINDISTINNISNAILFERYIEEKSLKIEIDPVDVTSSSDVIKRITKSKK